MVEKKKLDFGVTKRQGGYRGVEKTFFSGYAMKTIRTTVVPKRQYMSQVTFSCFLKHNRPGMKRDSTNTCILPYHKKEKKQSVLSFDHAIF